MLGAVRACCQRSCARIRLALAVAYSLLSLARFEATSVALLPPVPGVDEASPTSVIPASRA